MIICCENVGMVFPINGTLRHALANFSFTAHRGEFVSIVGPSGCGKSTLLRLLAGMLQPTSGAIERIPEPSDGIGGALLVRQENALFPWKTALHNAAFGLEIQNTPRAERESRARNMLTRYGLGEFAHAYPKQLSVGMKQRVAIIRAFLSNPAMLLLDEPFGALDAQTRLTLQTDLLRVWSETENLGAIFVTHDVEEAILLSDRILVLSASPGSIVGEWRVPLERPRSAADMLCPEVLSLKRELMVALGVPLEFRVHA